MGSGKIITDKKGNIYEYYLNLPFGETMLEQQTNRYYKNRYKFTGKELDEKTGLYDFGARHYNPSWSVWLSVDPMAADFAAWSPYNFVLGNPINLIDPDGRTPVPPDNFVFDESGSFVRIDVTNQPDQIVIENSTTGATQGTFTFNDPVEDPAAIRSGNITNVSFISESQINQQMIDNGSTTTTENRWVFIERESRPAGDESLLSGRSSGLLDHVASSPLVQRGTLHLINGNGSSRTGTAFNDFDFGNFLWGQAGRQLGFSIGTLQGAAHLNNAVNGRTDNPGVDTGILDSPGDQRAIRQGFFFPNGEPNYDIHNPQKNPGAFKPWESKF